MADFDTIKQEINVNIPDNNSQYITAKKVRDTLLDMIDDVDEAKQDALVSGTNIKTINGYTLLGPGDIVIEAGGDLSAYVSKEELSNMGYVTSNYLSQASYVTSNDLSQAGYVTQNALNSASYVTQNELNNMSYVTESQLQQAGYVTQSALNSASYATTSQLADKQDALVSGTNIKTINGNSLLGSGDLVIEGGGDLSAYVSKVELSSMGYITMSDVSACGYITVSDVSQMGYITASDLPDMSSYATLTYLETYYATLENVSDTANTMQQVLIDANIITVDPETGDMTVEEMATETYVADYVSTYAPTPDLSAYVSKVELSNMSYVTASALSNMSYATTTQVNAKQDVLVSGTNIKTINNESLLGSGNITIAGGGSNVTGVTQAQYDAMEQAGTLDPTVLYVITDATGVDLSDYVELTYLETYYADKTYVAEYVAAYAPTPDLSAYVTKTELSNASYVTQSALNNMSYVTASALSNMGYITSIPSEYVTQSELSGMSYATTSQLADKQDTLVSGTNIKTINSYSLLGSGNIEIQGGSVTGAEVIECTQAEYTAYEQGGTLDPTAIYVITDATPIDLSYYVELTYAQTYYVSKTDLNNASYVTQTSLSNNSYVTQTSLSNNGYLTSSNFIYDSVNNVLTISI